MYNKKYLSAAISALTLCVSAQVGAKEASFQLEEIIVTAQKRAQSLQDVPISVSAFSNEALELQTIYDIESLIYATPFVALHDGLGPSSTSFSIRGISAYAIEGGIQPSVSVVVDGVAFARAGEFMAELPGIERVEILRGPQGTLFGRNSTAGVINITTKPVSDEFEGDVNVSFTDESEQRVTGRISGPITDTVGYSAEGFYLDRDGFLENVYPGGDDFGALESYGFRGKLDVDFTDNVNVVFSGDYRKNEGGWGAIVSQTPEAFLDDIPAPGLNLRLIMQGDGDPELGRRIMDDLFKVNLNDQDGTKQELESWGLAADLTWDINENMSLKSITAYREWDESGNPEIDAGPGQVSNGGYGLPVGLDFTNIDSAPSPMGRYSTFEYVTQEFRLEGQYDKLDWIVGVYLSDFEEEIHSSVSVWVPFISALQSDFLSTTQNLNTGKLRAASVFGDVIFHLTDTVDLFGGLRFSQESADADYDGRAVSAPGYLGVFTVDPATNSASVDTSSPLYDAVSAITTGKADEDHSDWSGRLGVKWAFSDDANVYAQVSRSFVGIATDLSRAGTPDNAFLDPTTSESFEVGLKSVWLDNRLQLNAALYYQNTEDLQQSTVLPGTIQVATLNAGDMEATGVELETVWVVSSNVSLSAAVAYMDAEVQNLMQPCWEAQDISTGCNVDADDNITTDPALAVQTDVSGSRPPMSPEWAYSLGVDVDLPFNSLPFDGFAFAGYAWQDDVHYTLNDDPVLYQDSYGLLDLTFGIRDKEDRYELAVFGKNVADEEFRGSLREAAGSISRKYGVVSRNARAYYGLRLKYNF